MWCRVFGLSKEALPAAALAEQVQQLAPQWRSVFQGDEQGWFRVTLFAPDCGEPAELDHYWATEAGIRSQLNTWAAWVEVQENNPNSGPLMERMIQTGQLFCLNVPAALVAGDVCWQLCRWLARYTDGVFQADGSGFHAADGTLLVAEAA